MTRGAPLDGLLVMDLSRLLPGPYCSLMLAHLGATVIKIEEPGTGDPMRHFPPVGADGTSQLFTIINQNKMSLTLNLATPEGQRILRQLAGQADVLLESFRPGVMDRLGLNYGRLSAENPRLIFVSLSGYGQEGPFAQRAGHDINYGALTALLKQFSTAETPPRATPLPLADLSGSLWTAVAILAALHQQDVTGRGTHLDMALLDGVAALSLLPFVGCCTGDLHTEPPSLLPTDSWACYGVYQTADDRSMALGALEPKFWQAFCTAVGREEWSPRQFAGDQAGLRSEVAALFRTQGQDYWVQQLSQVDCCCDPVLTVAEALAHPQLLCRGLIQPGYAPLPLGTRSGNRLPAPSLGQHTAEILGRLGYDDAAVSDLRERGVL